MMDKKGSTGVTKRWVSLSHRPGISAGVVLGYMDLTIVIARSVSAEDYEIIGWGKEPYGEGITRKSPELYGAIKSILNRYLKPYRSVHIWCMMQSKGVETRLLILPDMAAKHLPLAVFWAFKKEVEIGNQEVVFDYSVTGERKTAFKNEREIMACSAPVDEIQELKSLFKRSGWPLTGVTVTSFAFQNLFRTGFAGAGDRDIATLFIGTDWSRIDIFSSGNLILSRDIKTGTRSMTEVIEEYIKKEASAGISIEAYLDKEEPLYDAEETGGKKESGVDLPIQANHFFDMIQEGDTEKLKDIFELIHPVVDRLIRQIERTFEHFSMTRKGQFVERLYFTGPLCGFALLLDYTGKQLHIPVSTVDVFSKNNEGKVPATLMEKDNYVPSAGLACSHGGFTQNFIHTYKDKNRERWNLKATQIFLTVMLLVVLTGLILHYGFKARERALTKEVKAMSLEIQEKEALYGKVGIIKFSSQIKEDKKRMSDLARSHYGAAVLSELSLLIPRDIRLISCEYEDSGSDVKPGKVTLKGLVFSLERQNLDGFIERLSSSSVIKSVRLTHVGEIEHGKKKEQYFEAVMELK